MPLSWEQVRRRQAHEALERGGTSTEGGRPPLERGRTSPEGVTGPRARRNLTRGGAQPPSEAEVYLCSAAPLERSGVLLEGGWAVCLLGRRGHQGRGPRRWAVSFVLSVFWVRLRFVFYESKRVFPGCLGDPYAIPDSSPQASVGVSIRIPQMLTLADGIFFPPVAGAIPWGRASGPVGLAPKVLQECGCFCKVFSQNLPVCGVLVSTGIGNIPAGLGDATRTYLALSVFGASQGV
jgi:hypothetical protein